MHFMLLTGALICCSLPTMALDPNSQCNVELNGNVQLKDSVLTVTLDNDARMTINQEKVLFINGMPLNLNTRQQGWVDDYYDGINQAVPQAAAIATDAISLVSTALNEVFTL
jgi:hypothetical protein